MISRRSTGRGALRYENVKLFCDGNSITAAAFPGASYPTQLAARFPFNSNGNLVVNIGVSSQTTQNMIADAATQIDAAWAAYDHAVVIAWEITNSIYFGATAQQAHDFFATYCAARRAAGALVVAVSALPRNQVSGGGLTIPQYNAALDDANMLLKENVQDYADGFLDVRQIPGFAVNPVSIAWMPDGIHLNEAGHTKFVDALLPVLLRLKRPRV